MICISAIYAVAIDGIPIYGPFDEDGRQLTNQVSDGRAGVVRQSLLDQQLLKDTSYLSGSPGLGIHTGETLSVSPGARMSIVSAFGTITSHIFPLQWPKGIILKTWAMTFFRLLKLSTIFVTHLYSQDLDECGGKVDKLGRYKYHLTMDPPYSISCLKGEVNLFSRSPGATRHGILVQYQGSFQLDQKLYAMRA